MSREQKEGSPILGVVGPTAGGKTELAIHLARKVDGSVVSADSRQVYVGMSLGTAKASNMQNATSNMQSHDVATPDVIDGVDHYLLNIREPDDPITLPEWQRAAFEVMDHLQRSGQSPILTGGTMLYVDSMVKNYDIPDVPVNSELRAELEPRDTSDLWNELIAQDSAAATFIEPHNKRRIIRALEAMEATGVPFSAQRTERPSRYHFKLIGLFPGWDELESNITKRVHAMFKDGLLEEVKTLADRYGTDSLPDNKWNWWNTMNYKQPLAVLEGSITQEEAVTDMIRANLRYARRQMSWWRGRDEVTWFTLVDHAVASGLHLDSPSLSTSASPAPSGTE